MSRKYMLTAPYTDLQAMQPRFDRGYTGHEMLCAFGLINMNGRLYDPSLQRFLSPDNVVQAPDNGQNYNRYSYCLNNPLRYTDPSGWESEPLGYAPNGMPFYTVEDYMTYYNYMSEMSSRSNYLRPGSNDFNGGWDTYDVVSNSFGNESWNGSTPSFGSGQDMLNYMNANGYNHYDSNNGFAIYTQDQSFDAACAYNDNFGSWGNTVAGSRRAAQYNYDNGLGAVNFSLMQSISANSVAISGSYNYNNRANPYKDFQGAFFGNGQDAINFAGMLSQNLYIEVTTLRTPINGGFLVLPFGNDCDYAHSSFSYIKSNGCYFFDWNGGRYEFDAMAHTHPFNSYPSISDQINAGKIGIPSYIFCPNKVFVTTGIGQYSPTNSINFFEQ